MRSLISNPNVDNSDPTNYPNARIKDNSGIGDGTAVNERTKGDLHQMVERLMILAGITANNLPDNVTNGYQIIDALIALASKNDYVFDLTTSGGVLQIPIKVALMKEGESLICKASSNLTSETTIKGSDNSVTAITVVGNFKANEYVRIIKSGSGVIIVRIADAASLNAMATELFFLKKASYAQEIAGSLDTVATTPQTNALAFVERVNGAASAASLATLIRNGLYPKEHFAIVAGLGASPTKNVGWFSGFDPGQITTPLAVGGNVTAAVSNQQGPGSSLVVVTLQNSMANTNYFVRISVQSQSGNMDDDNGVSNGVFKPFSNNRVDISFAQFKNNVQNLKVHIEVVQL